MRLKKTKDRQKIRMEKMKKERNLMVTFSKRRSGLFKKASELCILCGVEMSIIAFSPRKNAYSFGHPSVESILDRFLAQSPEPYSSTTQLINVHRNASVYEFNTQLSHSINQLEIEKKKSEELSKIEAKGRNNHSWKAPIECQGQEDLEKLMVAMGWLKINIEEHKKSSVENNLLAVVPFLAPSGICGNDNREEINMTPNECMRRYGLFGG